MILDERRARAAFAFVAGALTAAYIYRLYSRRRRDFECGTAKSLTDEAYARDQVKLKHEFAALANAGNLAGDASNGGALKSLTREECGGSCESYAWTQDEREICVLIDCDASASPRDVRVEVLSGHLVVVVSGKTILNGALTRRVIADECLWEMDSIGGGRKRVTVTLVKAKKTYAKFHWPSVCEGEPSIDVEKFGHPVVGVNNQDSSAMEMMMDDVHGMRRDASN